MAHAHAHGAAGDEHDEAFATDPGIERAVWIAVAVCAASVLVGLVLLWPDGDRDRSAAQELSGDPVAADVQSVDQVPCSYDVVLVCKLVTFRLTEGPEAGTTASFEQDINSTISDGDGIYVTAIQLGDGSVVYSFYEFQRGTALLLLAIVFVAAVVLLGRWRGLGAIGGLAVSLLVLVVFALPSLLDGNNAVAVALVASGTIAFLALYLAHGLNAATSVALLSTFASLALTGALAWVFVRAANFTGFTDDPSFFLSALGVEIDARGVLLAGIVIGSLGVLDDVTVTQVSTVWEMRRVRPDASRAELYASALRIGRDHISSTVNTLFLAYAGAALPLLLLFTEAGRSVGSVVTSEVVAVEVVRSLVGSVGLVASVPISTWLATRVATA